MNEQCEAVLMIQGGHYKCEVELYEGSHFPMAHSNREAESIWMGDKEMQDWYAHQRSINPL